MPIDSDKVRLLEDKDDSGMKCILEERERIVAEFKEFIAVGITEDELHISTVTEVDRFTEVLGTLIKMYKRTWEQAHKDVYGYQKEITTKDIVEALLDHNND